jgi:hypothetical protein
MSHMHVHFIWHQFRVIGLVILKQPAFKKTAVTTVFGSTKSNPWKGEPIDTTERINDCIPKC